MRPDLELKTGLPFQLVMSSETLSNTTTSDRGSQVLVNPSLSCCHMTSNCEREREWRESCSPWALRRSSAHRNAREWQRKPNATMTIAGVRMVPNTSPARQAFMAAMIRF